MTSNPEQCCDLTDVVDSALQIGSTELTTSAESEQQICSALGDQSESAYSALWLQAFNCCENNNGSTVPHQALWSLHFTALKDEGLLFSRYQEKLNAQNNEKPSSPKSAKSKEPRNNTSNVKPTEDAFKKQGREQLLAIFPGAILRKRRECAAAIAGHLYELEPYKWFKVCPNSITTRVSKLKDNNGKKFNPKTVNRAVTDMEADGFVETLDNQQQKERWGKTIHNGRVARLREAARNGTWMPGMGRTNQAEFVPPFVLPSCRKIRQAVSVESTPVQLISAKEARTNVDGLSSPLHPSKEGFTEKDQDRRLEASVLVLAQEEKKAAAANSIHPLGDLMIKIQNSQTTTAMAAVLETCGTEEIGGVLNPAGQVSAPAKPKPLENHPERVSVDEKAEIQPTAPLDTSEDLPDASEEELRELFGPYLPFGSKIYIKHPEFSAPSLATVCTADQLVKYQIANKSIPVDHLVVVTIAGVTKAVPCILLSARE